MTSPEVLLRILRAAGAEVERIIAEERAERRDWTSQESSPLGRRRHINAVRKRVARGGSDAAIVGRRALLSITALAEELAAVSIRKPQRVTAVAGDLRAELGLRVVGAQR